MNEAVSVLIKLVLTFMLFIGAWYLFWTSTAKENTQATKRSITFYNQRFSVHDKAQVTIAYENLNYTGFPFSYDVRLIKPSVTVQKGKERYQIITSYMQLDSIDSENLHFEVKLPKILTVHYIQSNQAPETYTLQFKQPPELFLNGLRIVRTEKGDVTYFSHFGFQMPKQMPVVVGNTQGKLREITFNFLEMARPVYLEIPDGIARHVKRFVHIMREAVVYTQQQPAAASVSG